MAYAADFYVPDNIIGYTGVLSKNPTVYFLSATHYGHITQVHDVWENVGRETVLSNQKYRFGNTGNDNCLVERDYLAKTKHPSRSPMILVGAAIPPELTHAIMVHQEQKALRGPREFKEYSKENVSRYFHPGQQPTKKERSAATQASICFEWELNRATGVPEDTRLFALSR